MRSSPGGTLQGRHSVPCPVVALDLDGVLVDSEPVKLASFLDAVRPDVTPEELALADRYNHAHRGIPRSQKFDHIARSILHVPAPSRENLITGWGRRYAAALEAREAEVMIAPGVLELLALTAFRFVVVSSAPEPEIKRLLTHHRLLSSFDEIHGHPKTKGDALAVIARQGFCVFVGDAPADAQAAHDAGVPFIGVGEAWNATSAPAHHVRSLADPALAALLTDWAARLLPGRRPLSDKTEHHGQPSFRSDS